jgi:cytochrome c oxidase subunit III
MAMTGLVATLAATTMLFAALMSAYLVRRGISDDWTTLSLPGTLYATALLGVGVSIAIKGGRTWIAVVIGVTFTAAHLYIWGQLDLTGPAAAFFMVLDGIYILHVIGGIIVLAARIDIASYYWLYLNTLWIALLTFFAVWP